jgi:O-antigen ligase
MHRLALALVWLTVASGAVVFSEPAPVDVLTLGLAVLLPVIGLVAMTRALLALLGLLLVAAASAFLAASGAADIPAAAAHTGVSLYLYIATFVFAAFVASRPHTHTRLILGAYTWAAVLASACSIVGYFDILPGTHELMTRWDRATGFFKDPNVLGPFLVPALVYAIDRLAGARLGNLTRPLATLFFVGLAILLTFSRGAWVNLAVAVTGYGALRVLTARQDWVRLKIAVLLVATVAGVCGLVLAALQWDEVANLLAERAALTQRYDEGPDGRFGGQQKAANLILEHPLGIGAQQFAPHYHHEEPHNVYLAMLLNAGWLGGLVFLGLVGSTSLLGLRYGLLRGATQPLFLVVYACFLANVFEGLIIDLDHWRHFYLLLALVWGMMAAPCGYAARATSSSRANSASGSTWSSTLMSTSAHSLAPWTSSAADWRPRLSPPAASAAFRAAMSRCAKGNADPAS